MIGIMNKLFTTLAVAAVAVLASPAFGQLKNPDGSIPTVENPNPAIFPWLVALLFAAGVISIAMKTPKRNRP